MIDMHEIHTDEHGRPFPRPERREFPPGIEGDIDYMRAVWVYKDRITSFADKAFAEAFSKAMRK